MITKLYTMYALGFLMLVLLILFIRYIVKSIEGTQTRNRWRGKKLRYVLELETQRIITHGQFVVEHEKLIQEKKEVEIAIARLEKRLSKRQPLFPPPQTDPDDRPMTWEEESNQRHYWQQDLSELYDKSVLLSDQIRMLEELTNGQR